jgi:hypothetical protein
MNGSRTTEEITAAERLLDDVTQLIASAVSAISRAKTQGTPLLLTDQRTHGHDYNGRIQSHTCYILSTNI